MAILDLIVSSQIDKKYLGSFSYVFMFDMLPENKALFDDRGVTDSYGLVVPIEDRGNGFAIPFYIEGEGFVSMTAPAFAAYHDQETLDSALTSGLTAIHGYLQKQGAPGMVLGIEAPQQELVQGLFSQLGYEVKIFEGR
jgi:hypothetical protein